MKAHAAVPAAKSAAPAARPLLTPARAPVVQRCCDGKGGKPCSAEEKKRKEGMLQRRASGPGPAHAPATVGRALGGPGRPLDPVTRGFMESRFGHDFGQVRIHTGPEAAASARAVSARAYTVGRDIAFDHGEYRPGTEPGRRLLAHELAHTVQQHGLQRAPSGGGLAVSSPGDALEREADAAAERVLGASATPAAPVPITHQPVEALVARQVGGREWTQVRNRIIQARGRDFHITRQQEGPGTAEGNVPRAVAFRVDVFYLPAEKGDILDQWNEAARAGALEVTLDVTRDAIVRTALMQSRAATTPDPGAGRNSSLQGNWLQKLRWPEACSGSLWFRAGGDPRRESSNAPTAPSSTVPASEFPRVRGETCHVDHIVDMQFGGSNVPSNLQVLDPTGNVGAGRDMYLMLRELALNIRDTFWPGDLRPEEMTLHFETVRRVGGQPHRCSDTPCTGTARGHASTCAQVECCARHLTPEIITEVCGAGPTTAPAGFVDYPLQAGGMSARLVVPARTASDQAINLGAQQSVVNPPGPAPAGTPPVPAPAAPGAAENRAAAEIVPGLVLTVLNYRRAGGATPRPDTIDAEVDERKFAGRRTPDARAETRRSSTLRGAQSRIVFNVQQPEGLLRLQRPGSRISFVYPYLSEGSLELNQDPAGELIGRGTIRPSLPLLNRAQLNVAFERGQLSGTTPIPERLLRPPIPGLRFTRSELGVELSPAFRPYGVVAFEIGRAGRPAVDGSVTAEADTDGLVLRGVANAHIPGVDQAQGTIEYRNGHWSGGIAVESTQIRLPGVQRGTLQVTFTDSNWLVRGGVVLALPGGQEADLRVQRRGQNWVYTGRGVFTIPGLNPVTLNIEYDGEHLTATGRTGITIRGLNGTLEVRYRDGRVSGQGQLQVNKGRARGVMTVRLSEAHRFSGEGEIQYQVSENLIATVGVELREDRSVRLRGALTFPRPIPLFRGFNEEKEFFRSSMNIGIPGLSIGPVGVVLQISGAFGATYGIGPGELRNARIEAALNPLDDNPDLDLHMAALLVIPAHAGVYLRIRGAIGVAAGSIASITGGISATGRLELRGGLEAGVDVHYQRSRFALEAHAEISAQPVLRLDLDADVTAEAGVGPFEVRAQKVWHLASFEYGSGLRFGLRAPIRYASDQPFRPPSLNDIQWITPTIRVDDVLGQIFGRARATES